MGTYHERSDEPFPSFHLCDLSSFTLADPSTLTSAQLALGALFFPDEAGCTLKQQAVRTWRRRREQGRARVGGKIGVFASAEERARERWPLFECIDLAFKVDNPLELLSSAQLVVSGLGEKDARVAELSARCRRPCSFTLKLRRNFYVPPRTYVTSPGRLSRVLWLTRGRADLVCSPRARRRRRIHARDSL